MESSKNVDITYRIGEDPEKDAWFTAFFIENHMDHFAYPDHVASPEQLTFMIHIEDDERYYPCSEKMFEAIINKNNSSFIQQKYKEVFQRIMELIDSQIEDEWDKSFLKALIRIKFLHETHDEMMIPSRLEKRLLKIFLNRTLIDDPFLCEKAIRNNRVNKAICSEAFKKAINQIDNTAVLEHPATLAGIKEFIEHVEIKRLLSLSVEKSLWESDESKAYKEDDFHKLFNRQMIGNGVKPLLNFLGIESKQIQLKEEQAKKILWLADESGEIIVDIAIIKYLAKLGHKIIIAFKEAPLYTKVDFIDVQADEILSKQLEGAFFIKEKNLGKNELVGILRSDNNIIAISDGTRENFNPLLTSKVFSRIFREVDGIISKGQDQKRRIFENHFQFTRDIFNISRGEDGSIQILYKPKHPSVIKFSHGDLERKAKIIIDQMEEAKKNGMTVIFYSGIIGSIPGKTKIAKKIMSAFINFLKSQFAMTFIINPAEYFETGMDADDLMYMWEIVQGSGYIDIWRFQSYDDIAKAFQIMDKKVPPEWVGKDATYSTGCTKEMRIALDVQKKHPEMQIIGPSVEKFMRRDEYGIGKMYDQRLSERRAKCAR
ncbi:MAG: protein-glutamate O-methyltransferase family protein [Proteobacteria bacterium]|nr:protein-glutamate O-methyltransferase family protein [Pseudomonadota bacterium]MBU4069115.1 protein-glutamate O-methyltransferase family protein [Pseudomonadota bacterium]MBU4100875.1 protein-glutamate O-methyltransferase family protein [Pseudomonadota bacterium]MBU4127618.1 protein-glutamate O-methyltransferase family protein [Pseudomonadota bacterium]